jgi:hypothetical protein
MNALKATDVPVDFELANVFPRMASDKVADKLGEKISSKRSFGDRGLSTLTKDLLVALSKEEMSAINL